MFVKKCSNLILLFYPLNSLLDLGQMSLNTKQYFYRTVVYGTDAENVYLIDIQNSDAKMESLEPWLGVVVSLADGQHSVAELNAYIATQYPDAVPDNLQDTIISVLERLQGEGVVKLSDCPVGLPYYLAEPVQKLDIEKAKRLMLDDGYIQSL